MNEKLKNPDATADALRALGQLPTKNPLPISEVSLHLVPREEGLASKEVPGEALSKKLVGVRDKLRVLEQRVNASSLSVEGKVALQAKVTAVYSSITGVNAFFSEDALGVLSSGEESDVSS